MNRRCQRKKTQHRWHGEAGDVDGTVDGEASKPLVVSLRKRTEGVCYFGVNTVVVVV